MAKNAGYTRLPDATRDSVRTAARTQAARAAERYTDLLAAEAGIAARAQFPHLAQLVFRLTDDVDGPSATLIAAYAANGRRLWHVDGDQEWPDESLVTDHLAAAADWCPDGYFPATAVGDDLFQLDLNG